MLTGEIKKLVQNNRYNANKLSNKKKYARKDYLYSEFKGVGYSNYENSI